MRLVCLLLLVCACEAPRHATRDLRIRLVDGDGKPASGNVWWAEDADAEYGESLFVPEGEIVLEEVPAEPIVVVALPDGFVVPSEGWPRVAIGADATEALLVLDVGAKRTLKVAGWTGKSFGTVRLAATTDLEPSHHGVEKDGTIKLEGLRPGVKYNLYVGEDDTGRCVLYRNLSADVPWPIVELGPGRRITGRLIAPAGCDGVSIALMVGKTVMVDAQERNDDGTFAIPGAPPGTWTVVAYTTFKGRYLATTAEAKPGKPIVLDLR